MGLIIKNEIEYGGGGGSDLALGETSSTAYRGDRGKIAYDDSQTNKAAIGILSNLSTTAKSDLVSAINEVKSAAGSGGGGGTTYTFDSTPTSGSTNPVTSGGVYSAISAAIGQALNTSY